MKITPYFVCNSSSCTYHCWACGNSYGGWDWDDYEDLVCPHCGVHATDSEKVEKFEEWIIRTLGLPDTVKEDYKKYREYQIHKIKDERGNADGQILKQLAMDREKHFKGLLE